MRLIGLGILIGCTTALIVASEINYYSQSETISTTITGTEVKRASKDTDKYLIYTPET